jgi:putative hemolysin
LEVDSSLFFGQIVLLGIMSNAGPILLVVLLIVCSALISSSEVALFSLTPSQREEIRISKSSSDKNILELLEKPDRETGPKKLLATVLIANNAVNIAIVLIANKMSEAWFPASNYASWVKTLMDVVVITFVIVLFGEVIPKVYATGSNLKVSRFMALPLIFIQKIFTPLTSFLMRASGLIEDKLKASTQGNISVDELGHALELTADDDRSAEEHKILEGIVTFGAKNVGQIMTHRMQVSALSVGDSFQEVLTKVMEKGYSRLPVYKDSADQIVGFLFIKDLLPYLDQTDFDWITLMKAPFFVPENKKIDDLLQEFKENKIHLAIVVDEYGGTSGLVTLEDILEEIVGDISDEFDEEETQYSKLDEYNYVFEGRITLIDLYKIIDLDDHLFESSKGDSSSLAGFVIEQAGRIPEKGDVVFFRDFKFTIEAADKRKIKRIKVTLPVTGGLRDKDS